MRHAVGVEGQVVALCQECGFDPSRWTPRDTATLLRGLGWWWKSAITGIPAEALNRRQAGGGVWSVLEYGEHTAAAMSFLRSGLEIVFGSQGAELPPEPDVPEAFSETPSSLVPRDVLEAIKREGQMLGRLVAEAPARSWSRQGTDAYGVVTAREIMALAVHEASHHQMDISRGLAAIGEGAPVQRGHVVQLNVSDGGVPKLAVERARVSHGGMDGDRQDEVKHHGRPFQALCLWSAEVIEALSDLGHSVAGGCAGENLTLGGLDWGTLRAGTRLRVGGVLAELSFPAIPCSKQARWFSDGDFRRINHNVNPQWARWYAWVREPGEVATGDSAIVRP
ncbi:MAG: MOSC domain-containing protein [Acidimicrobiales bacterium]